jgi:tRNA(Ile)-lysidine synthase
MNPIQTCVRDAIARLGMAQSHGLVAVSGGVDSSVLLHALSQVADEFELVLDVVHLNHGLRGEASEGDQKCVEGQAAVLGLPCHTRRVDVGAAREGHASRTRPTVQEAARHLRRDALVKIAEEVGAKWIATAHHLDDQAETVLMRLMRGASGDGLAGIPEISRDGMVVRPLLRATREDIETYARAAAIIWREDASNQDDRYARNRVRREILPLLKDAFNPQLARTLANLAQSQRRDADWIASVVDEEFGRRFRGDEENGYEIVKEGWGELHEALSTRLIVRAFEGMGAGRDQSRIHIARMVAFLSEGPGAPGGREIELPGGLRVKRLREKFLLYRIEGETG